MDTAPSAANMTTSPRAAPAAGGRQQSGATQHIILQNGQVFWTGSQSIGQGTQGLGGDASACERTMHEEGLKAYFQSRDETVRAREAKQIERLKRIEYEQSKSARVKLREAREAHEDEITRMVAERKAHESDAKAAREAAAAVKNAEIHVANQRQKREAALARERRGEQQRRALETVRQQRGEMLGLQAEEREAQADADRRAIAALRQQHMAAKARAAEEAGERREHKTVDVQHTREEQLAKEGAKDQRMKDIVQLKGSMIATQRDTMRRQLAVTMAVREDALCANATEMRTQRKELTARRAERRLERRRETEDATAGQRSEADAARRGHEEHRRQQFDMRRQRARRQREATEAEVREQRAAAERERERYVRQTRELVERSHKASEGDAARRCKERALEYAAALPRLRSSSKPRSPPLSPS